MVAGKKETHREGEVTEHTLHNTDENIPKKKEKKTTEILQLSRFMRR